MTVDELVLAIRRKFDERISEKTGWGKNEIMKTLDAVILEVSLSALRDKIDNEVEEGNGMVTKIRAIDQ